MKQKCEKCEKCGKDLSFLMLIYNYGCVRIALRGSTKPLI